MSLVVRAISSRCTNATKQEKLSYKLVAVWPLAHGRSRTGRFKHPVRNNRDLFGRKDHAVLGVILVVVLIDANETALNP